MARTVDRAVADLVDEAPHVRADGTERLEVTGGRLCDDDLLGGEDLAAADRDLAGGSQGIRPVARCRRRGGACGACAGASVGGSAGAGGGGARTARRAGADGARKTHDADASQHAPSGGSRVPLWFLCHKCSCSVVWWVPDGRADSGYSPRSPLLDTRTEWIMAGFTGVRKSAVSTVKNLFMRPVPRCCGRARSLYRQGPMATESREPPSVTWIQETNPDTADADSVRRCGQCLESSSELTAPLIRSALSDGPCRRRPYARCHSG